MRVGSGVVLGAGPAVDRLGVAVGDGVLRGVLGVGGGTTRRGRVAVAPLSSPGTGVSPGRDGVAPPDPGAWPPGVGGSGRVVVSVAWGPVDSGASWPVAPGSAGAAAGSSGAEVSGAPEGPVSGPEGPVPPGPGVSGPPSSPLSGPCG